MRNALSVCRMHGRFLYEARPDFFPQGWMTDIETELWIKHYEDHPVGGPRKGY